MAGGLSSRMRNSTGKSFHKALAQVFDIPLIELNLLYAYNYGFKNVWISISINEVEIIDYVKKLQRVYDKNLGITIHMIIERSPLGTIGAVQFVECKYEPLLILFVDNLLDINLTELMTSHVSAKADMTIVSHKESFQVPFGELVVEGDQIIQYIEKPEHEVLISSGTYVLGEEVQYLIRNDYPDKRIDVHNLAKVLISQNFKMLSYFHTAFWADINDQVTLLRVRGEPQWPLIKKISELKRKFE